MTHLGFKKYHTGKGPAVEVERLPGQTPTRYRYKHGIVEHHVGKHIVPMEERLGFRGKSKVVEIAFVPVKK